MLRLLKVCSVANDMVLPESTIALIGLPLSEMSSDGYGSVPLLSTKGKALPVGWAKRLPAIGVSDDESAEESRDGCLCDVASVLTEVRFRLLPFELEEELPIG